MAHNFCVNHRTFTRFSSSAVSLQRLGYDRRDINRLLRHDIEEWHRDNIPVGYSAQGYPYHCELGDECGQCQSAYHSRKSGRFRSTVQAFCDLYRDRGWLEFQSLTIPPFAPKPAYVHHVVHDTSETEEYYQAWLRDYFRGRLAAARESFARCLENWRERGRRRPVDIDVDLEEREYETVPVSFPKTALRCIPEELLSQRERQRVYAIITNEVKDEERELVAAERGFKSVAELFQAAPDSHHERLRELLSEIALVRLRELKAEGVFSERVKDWFARAEVNFGARLLAELGIWGLDSEVEDANLDVTLLSELLEEQVHDAWLLRCWHNGWMQACVDKARKYIPLQTERVMKRDGRHVIRQEYGPVTEPSLLSCETLPEDCPVFRMPRVVLTEMLGLYRRRLRRAGIQFRYVQVREAGQSEEHHHVHCIIGFHEFAGKSRSELRGRRDYRFRMQQAWHAVSGNIIWKRGRWSEAIRRPERAGSYLAKYLSKNVRGRQTWVSHHLGIKRYAEERRLVDVGLLPERDAEVAELEHGGYRFVNSFTDAELETAGADKWVGLVRLGDVAIPGSHIPLHYRVEAVAESTRCPSLGKAAGIRCVHRARGTVDVVPRCDVWLPAVVFERLASHQWASSPQASRLLSELNRGLNKTSHMGDFLFQNRHNPVVLTVLRRQQAFGQKAFSALSEDYLSLCAQLTRGP